MKTRLITGTCYVAVLVAFYLLKIFVHDYFFDALIYAFALLGTWEMIRAMQDKMTKPQKVLVFLFALFCIPLCAVMENMYRYGLHVTAVCFIAFSVSLLILLVTDHEKTNVENMGVSFLCAVYPVLLLCMLVLTNHVDNADIFSYSSRLDTIAFNSNLLILMVFVISPFADSFAYVFGCLLGKRFPKKMAPSISPNKTVVGGFGGLFGGMLGAGILYFAYNAIVVGKYVDMYIWLPIYLAIGLLTAIATAFGDLVESCIKRKLGVKDMGKLLPGHGGVLDRIDGTLFACLAVYIAFVCIRLLA